MSVANIGGGSYRVTFSAPVTVVTPGNPDIAIVLRSSGSDEWVSCQGVNQFSSTEVDVEDQNDATDCNAIAIMEQPTNLHAADPFATANGITYF
ncbi:MAG: hypothetical protein JO270_08290 [Acidobacteriaceae bacterium]|nr:hypothetical protein [Acidobacteriaceae bacterium]